MAIEDADCDCEIPLDMDDSELEIFCRSNNTRNASLRRSVSCTPSSSGLSGFLSLLRLCQISGKITRSVNYVHLKQNRKEYKKAAESMRLARELDLELESWLKTVPDPITYLASSARSDSSGDAHLTMYIIIYIVHAGCVINLHWYVFSVVAAALVRKLTPQATDSRCRQRKRHTFREPIIPKMPRCSTKLYSSIRTHP